MKLWTALASALLLSTLLGGCTAPSENAYGHRDSFDPTPFWERNTQRDR